jgi:hypothetical protein
MTDIEQQARRSRLQTTANGNYQLNKFTAETTITSSISLLPKQQLAAQ